MKKIKTTHAKLVAESACAFQTCDVKVVRLVLWIGQEELLQKVVIIDSRCRIVPRNALFAAVREGDSSRSGHEEHIRNLLPPVFVMKNCWRLRRIHGERVIVRQPGA